MASSAIVGTKVGMTQIWDDARHAFAVTVVKVAPLRVVQVRTPERDGYSALQVTYGFKQAGKLNRPEAGHFSKASVEPGVGLWELSVEDVSGYSVGQQLGVEVFTDGDLVDVTALSKGKGFAGGMKRHNFKGQGASHGNHKKHRAPGSVGACATPARVFKGTRMAGRLGGDRVTTLNLKVIKADPERELLLVHGSVPGPAGGLVVVRSAVKAAVKGGSAR